jgi:hypothetical protein
MSLSFNARGRSPRSLGKSKDSALQEIGRHFHTYNLGIDSLCLALIDAASSDCHSLPRRANSRKSRRTHRGEMGICRNAGLSIWGNDIRLAMSSGLVRIVTERRWGLEGGPKTGEAHWLATNCSRGAKRRRTLSACRGDREFAHWTQNGRAERSNATIGFASLHQESGAYQGLALVCQYQRERRPQARRGTRADTRDSLVGDARGRYLRKGSIASNE